MLPAIKCDRCGNIEENIGVRIFIGEFGKEKRVCNPCYNSFTEWWKYIPNTMPQGEPGRECPLC